MRRGIFLLAVLAMAACSSAKTNSTSSPTPVAKTYTSADASTLVLAENEGPGETKFQAEASGSVPLDQFWIKDRADLQARWRELGYQGGFKRSFRVEPAVERLGLKQLPEGVLYAISYSAVFKDAVSAKAAVALMGSSVKAQLTDGGNSPETVDAAALGDGAFGLTTYLAKFTDYNSQYGWADGNAARAIVVVGTQNAAIVALQIAQRLHA